MKPEIAKIWVEALRSGEYEQGRNNLNCENKFCCLGVLCELAIKNGLKIKKQIGHYDQVVIYNCKSTYPPAEVIEWAGMWSRYGVFNGETNSLANLNDNGKSFAYIADIIETNVEKL